MAADRSRLAAALAYKQAEEERRRRMLESIPTPAGTAPAQPAPQADFRTNLENLSIGVGEGLTNQLEGVRGLVTDPVGTAKGVYEAGKAVVRDPAIIASALRQMGQKAMSGPLGAGEVIGEMLGPRKTGPVMAELDVYHGTPHRFPATEVNPLGEFDASKIGTGEGAQAFGHGIYLAENPTVAQDYQFMLSKIDPSTTTYQGKPVEKWYEMAQVEQDRAHRLRDQKAIDRANAKLAFWENVMTRRHPEDAKRVANDPDDGWPTLANYANSLDMSKFGGVGEAGSFYKADLPDEMIDRMLDWDKPLSEQRELATPILKELGYLRPTDDGPRQFSQAVKALALEHGGFGESGATGMALFNAIYKGLQQGKPKAINLAKRMNLNEQEMFMEASPLASEVMKRMGIPGIKYLDAGSRGKSGTGTRNFVVFPGEEKKVRILERDGQKAPPQKIAQALEEIKPVTTAVEIPEALHGSPVRGLTELSPSKAMEVRGTTWFSDNADIADQYTFPREYGEILYDAEPGEIYKAGLSFKNPLTVDFKGKVGDAIELSKLVEQAKKQGYDGLIIRNVDDSIDSSKVLGTSYAVFDRNQIKLKK